MSACSSLRRALGVVLLLAAGARAEVEAPPLQVATDGTGVCFSPWQLNTASSEFVLLNTGGSCAQNLSGNVTMLGPVVGDVADEAVFFDGAATDQTCGTGNEGRHRVLDAGPLEYCDGATTTMRTVVEKDLAQTLTGKTYDADATGNVLTMPVEQWFAMARCAVATGTATWNTTSVTAPQGACTGSTVHDAVLNFDGTADECVEMTLVLPTSWVGVLDVAYKWLTTATSGSATWCSQFVCVADGATNDPAYPAQAATNCVADAAKAGAAQVNDVVDLNVPATGCAAGALLHWRLCRDPDATAGLTDDITADASLLQAMLRWRVAL